MSQRVIRELFSQEIREAFFFLCILSMKLKLTLTGGLYYAVEIDLVAIYSKNISTKSLDAVHLIS